MNSVSQGEAQATMQLAEDLNCIFSIPGDALNFGVHLALEPVLKNVHMGIHTFIPLPNLSLFVNNISMLKLKTKILLLKPLPQLYFNITFAKSVKGLIYSEHLFKPVYELNCLWTN